MQTTLPLALLGLLSAGAAYAGITGTQVPLLGTTRAALIALTVLGMTMCALGMRVTTFSWLHPSMIAGSIFGAAALVVAIAGIFGFKLPLVTGPRDAIIALVCLMAVKILIDVVRMRLA